MQRIFVYLFFGLITVILLNSCKTTKLIEEEGKDDIIKSEEILQSIESKKIDFRHFNSSARLDISTEMFSGSANARIRLVKDSAIWIAVSKLGFEIGRALITPDTIFGIERIQKTYIKTDYDYLSEQIGFNVDYKFLEDFIIGNPYFAEEENRIDLKYKDTINVFPIIEGFLVHHRFAADNLNLLTTKIRDEELKMDAYLDYNDYQELTTENNFAFERNVRLEEGIDETTEVNIKFTNPEINVSKPIRFSIPKSYSYRDF